MEAALEQPLTLDEVLDMDEQVKAFPPLKTKTVMWQGDAWQIRVKPGAVFLDAFEDDRVMAAAKSIMGAEQYKRLLDRDPDLEGKNGLEGFFEACNKAWGVGSGN